MQLCQDSMEGLEAPVQSGTAVALDEMERWLSHLSTAVHS